MRGGDGAKSCSPVTSDSRVSRFGLTRTRQRASENRLTACWSKTFTRLQFQILARFPFRKPLPACTRKHACASLLMSSLHDFLTENRSVLFPGNAHASSVRDTHIFLRRRTRHKLNLPGTAGPAKLARHLPARAATRKVISGRSQVKRIATRAAIFFQNSTCVARVTSPNSSRAIAPTHPCVPLMILR